MAVRSLGRDEMEMQDVRQRYTIHSETRGGGRIQPPPKSRSKLVHICLPEDSTTMRKLESNRVTKALVDKLFGLDIDHLMDQFGTVVFPHEWTRRCKPAPYVYFAYVKKLSHTIPDAATDLSYIGETGLFLFNVNPTLTEVDLATWFRAVMISTNPIVVTILEELRLAQEQLERSEFALDLLMDVGADESEATKAEKGKAELKKDMMASASAEVIEERKLRLGLMISRLKTGSIPGLQLRLRELLTSGAEVKVKFIRIGPQHDGAEDALEKGTELIVWQVYFEDDELGTLASQALSVKEWGKARIIPAANNGGEPLAFYTQGATFLTQLNPSEEAEFREQFLRNLYDGVRDPNPYKHIVTAQDDPRGAKKKDKAKEAEKAGEGKKGEGESPDTPKAKKRLSEKQKREEKEREAEEKEKVKSAKREAEDEHLRQISVNMKGVALVRLRHGYGASMGEPPMKDMYTGRWYLGAQTGRAVEVSKSGVYDGNFEKGRRSGYGSMRFTDGTIYDGLFGNAVTRKKGSLAAPSPLWHRGPVTRPQQLTGPPYMAGYPDGHGVLKFPDGSEYVGQLKDGAVTGVGRYSDANGDMMEGEFLKGTLHGEGMHYLKDGTILCGHWKHGILDREGIIIHYNGDVYVGGLAGNQPDGYGVLIERGGDAVYDGGFLGGAREGRGVQAFRTRSIDAIEPSDQDIPVSRMVGGRARLARMEKRGGYLCEGEWCGGSLSHGVVTRVPSGDAADTLFSRKLKEGINVPGTWLDRASVLYNEWLRVKRGAQAASSAKEAAMRRLQPSLSIAVEAGYAAAANAANRQDAAKPEGTASPTGPDGISSALLGSLAETSKSKGKLSGAGPGSPQKGAVNPLGFTAKSQSKVAKPTPDLWAVATTAEETGQSLRPSTRHRDMHGLAPLSHIMMTSTAALYNLPTDDDTRLLRTQTEDAYKETLKKRLAAREAWIETNNERLDDCTEDHLKQYRTVRRLWKGESRAHARLVEKAVAEAKEREAATAEAMGDIEAEMMGGEK